MWDIKHVYLFFFYIQYELYQCCISFLVHPDWSGIHSNTWVLLGYIACLVQCNSLLTFAVYQNHCCIHLYLFWLTRLTSWHSVWSLITSEQYMYNMFCFYNYLLFWFTQAGVLAFCGVLALCVMPECVWDYITKSCFISFLLNFHF